MGELDGQIDDKLAAFIGRQHGFFVGTAPTEPESHLNIPPKGLDTFPSSGRTRSPTST